MKDWGHEPYRVGQVLNWLYANRAESWDVMTNLPLKLRQRMKEEWTLHVLEWVRQQAAEDGTRKFLWRLPDGHLIESVLIPANRALYGDPSDRQTLCLSTQVGCAYGCAFCASGLNGFRRNLEVEEIVEQVLAVERWYRSSIAQAQAEARTAESPHPVPRLRSVPRNIRSVDNIVVMGMGEPLANYDPLLKALAIINAPWGAGIGARKITISTSGLAPQIRRLAREPAQYRLAVSLHGATDAVRDRLMPVNRKYPLRELLAACDDYLKFKGRMITLEYVLIAGVNDSPAQTAPLADIAHRLKAKVNLIPYNPVEDLTWTRPAEADLEAFHAALLDHGVQATLRREKGSDVDAACGQLRLKTERGPLTC
ncbi:MAG: 23S rRNA (adenine(2503)-C(2))-methyltransferase RlmN [Verrucomicrobia bacterium]|nr:23S rRNA (adenine(2503)-C(2))-methyltransferase RlmN [Verrucomicrobiota bacterium]